MIARFVKGMCAGRAVARLIPHPRDGSEAETPRPLGWAGAAASTGLIRPPERSTGVEHWSGPGVCASSAGPAKFSNDIHQK